MKNIESKKITAIEIFTPVVKKFDRTFRIPQYKDECCLSVQLIPQIQTNTTNTSRLILPSVIITLQMLGQFLLKVIQEKTTTAFREKEETSRRKRQKVWTDRGKEFSDETFLDFFERNGTQLHSTHTDLKAVFNETFNKTLLVLGKEQLYIEGKAFWLNHLDAAVGSLVIVSIMLDVRHLLKLIKKLILNVIPYLESTDNNKFQVGDYVKVPDKRSFYSKSYTTNLNRGLFKKHKTNPTNPITFVSQDENTDEKKGNVYEKELLGSVFNFEPNNNTVESMNIFHQYDKIFSVKT